MGTMITREINVYVDSDWTEITSGDATEDDYQDAYSALLADGWTVMTADAGSSYRHASFNRDDLSRDICYMYPDDEAREREARYYALA